MKKLKQELLRLAEQKASQEDMSHDFSHALRVLDNAKYLASYEGGDLAIIIPAALFHDIVIYPKNDPRSDSAADESALAAKEILTKVDYPKEKIPLVMQAIAEHSYPKGVKPKMIESKILQDADRLECTGAIAIMRSFSSTGQMKRPFYDLNDPFCTERKAGSSPSTLDFVFTRLLKMKFNTVTATKLAKARIKFIESFVKQLKEELVL